ncbi:MAG TPA: acyltransferase family protein [Aeromicrobium sp.]|nr:acyltransferase family protein [Aeromicrobium sp.]
MNKSQPNNHRIRPEIQGLRAIAVSAVVLYHLGLSAFSGGYVGVDVFFVISGFLITSHIARGLDRDGRLNLGAFWGRRARRLLPASLLVLAVCLVLTYFFIPATMWEQTFREIFASTFYVQNWALARDSVDYSALGNTPTLVQHYWSLSVEEQFYVFWPVLLVIVLLLTRQISKTVPTRAVLIASISLVTISSLVWSVIATNANAGHAYFDTGTRMWEFGIGGLLALAPRIRFGALLGWLGLAAIGFAALTYSHATAFPGYLALVPVLGTAMAIGAGSTPSRWSPGRLLSTRPAVFVGDYSYAIYLWHWPLIVIWPQLSGSDIGALDRSVIVALTLLLSWASTRWIEEPLRSGPLLTSGRYRTLIASVSAMALVAGATYGLNLQHERNLKADRLEAAKMLVAKKRCLGPAALDPERNCDLGDSLDSLLASPATVAAENANPVFPGCQSSLDELKIRSCRLGESANPRARIAAVGDSHTTHWFSALDAWGKKNQVEVVTYTRSSCPFTSAERTLPAEPAARYARCAKSNAEVLKKLTADEGLSLVVTSTFSSAYGWKDSAGRTGRAALTAGFAEIERELAEADIDFQVVRDVPLVKDKKNATDCLAATNSVADCSLSRSDAMVPDLYAEAAAGNGIKVIDLTDRFCTDSTCPVVVGNVIVFRDYSHLSADYSRLLGPILGDALGPLP